MNKSLPIKTGNPLFFLIHISLSTRSEHHAVSLALRASYKRSQAGSRPHTPRKPEDFRHEQNIVPDPITRKTLSGADEDAPSHCI